MSSRSSIVTLFSPFKLFCIIIIISICNLVGGSHLVNSNSNSHHHNINGGLLAVGDNSNNNNINWQRNLEAQLSRVVGRLDQLELRVGRTISLIQMRFDSIENGQTTSKLRMDLWGDELNRIEEQLSRKWKILESKFDMMIGNIDTKLDSKLTAMQRDNRRHNEFLTSAINAVANGQEKMLEKVSTSMNEMNSSLFELKNQKKDSESSNKVLLENGDKMLTIMSDFIANSSFSGCGGGGNNNNKHQAVVVPVNQNNQTTNYQQYQLLGNKVTNMFEDLMRRSTSMEVSLKEQISITNGTRKDVHDGFRLLLSTSQQQNSNSHLRSQNGRSSSSSSSSEVMSAVIVEALASVDSMSSALGRKITELSRSMDERLEIVSMSINGFLESCVRIQDQAPLIEDNIADLLIRIVDTVDNSTRQASELWLTVAREMLEDRHRVNNMTRCGSGGGVEEEEEEEESSIVVGESHHHQPHHHHSSTHISSGEEESGNEVVVVLGAQDGTSTYQQQNHHNTDPSSHRHHNNNNHDDDVDEIINSSTITDDDDSREQLMNRRRHNNGSPPQPPPPPASSSQSSTHKIRGGDTLSEEDKNSIWQSLRTLSPST